MPRSDERWRPIVVGWSSWPRGELPRLIRLCVGLVLLGALPWVAAALLGGHIDSSGFEARLAARVGTVPSPVYFASKNLVACVFAFCGVFTFGLTAMFTLVGVGFGIGVGLAIGLDSEGPNLALLGATVLPHGLFELPAVVWAAAHGLAGARQVGPVLRNDVLRIDLDRRRLVRAALGVVVLIVAAACVEAWVTPQVVTWWLPQ